MARKIKKASHYLLILALAIMLIGFNLIGSNYWGTLTAEADISDITYTSVSVQNVAPTVSNVKLGTYPRGVDTATITLVEDTDIDIVVSATVTDSTCADMNGGGVKAYVFAASVSWEYDLGGTTCSWNYNECYVPKANGGVIQCVQQSCAEGTPATAVYDCAASATADGMWYHADPTDSTSSWSSVLGWYAMVIASDSAGGDSFATNSAETIELNRLNSIGLDAASDSIAYGAIAPGSESAAKGRGVKNTGNHEIDLQINATDALQTTDGDSIASEQQEYCSVSFSIAEGDGTSLSETATNYNALILTKPASHSAGLTVDDEIYWGIAIPAATNAGLYQGQTTYTATGEQ